MKPKYLNTFRSKALKGIVSIEFVLMMTAVFTPIVIGTLEVGRVFYQYNTITKAVRDGVRYISLYSATDPNYDAKKTEAINLVLKGNTAGTGNLLVPGLDNTPMVTMVSINTISVATAGSIKLVTVTVTGFKLGYITTYFIGRSKAFNPISATMRQATT